MRQSISIGRIGEVRTRLHVTFLACLAWIAIVPGRFTPDTHGVLSAAVPVLMVLATVVLHELGHEFAAGRYGIRTQEVVLLPIGGIARLERAPERAAQQLAVALAGPSVNLAIIGVLYAFFPATRSVSLASLRAPAEPAAFLMAANQLMVAFNLIPALPMDGGRIVRALLVAFMPESQARRGAAAFGQIVALGFGMIGLFGNSPVLVAIGLFVFLIAAEERPVEEPGTSLSGVPVRDAMLTDFVTLDVADPLQRAIDYLMAGSQADFPVLEGQVPIGTLGRADLIVAIQREGVHALAGRVVKRDPAAAAPGEPLEGVVKRMRARGRTALPVLENGRVVGLVTIENIGDLLAVNESLKKLANAA
jgi:Zn-dependent protease/predicted transcriptional regulator